MAQPISRGVTWAGDGRAPVRQETITHLLGATPACSFSAASGWCGPGEGAEAGAQGAGLREGRACQDQDQHGNPLDEKDPPRAGERRRQDRWPAAPSSR
jgi:hypothetical protein